MGLDLTIVLFFLLINLWIGIRFMNRTSTLQQYATDSKEFTTSTIVVAILTLSYGGGILYHQLNRKFLLVLTGIAISYFIIGSLLSYRLQPFLNSYSVAEIMGKLYGKVMRKIVAACGLLSSIVFAALHLKAVTVVLDWFFHTKSYYSLLMAILIITSSVGSGNIKSLTFTNIIRCAAFIIILPTIAWILWKNINYQFKYDTSLLTFALKDSLRNVIHIYSSPFYYIALLMIFSVPSLHPAQVQRILVAEHATQLKYAFNYAGLCALGLNIFLIWMALLLNQTYGCSISGIPPSIFNNYWGLKGFFVISVITLATSAANTHLHAATVLIVNDIQNTPTVGRSPAMHFNRYAILLGLAATFLTLCIKNPLKVLLTMHCINKITIAIPLLVALMGIYLHAYVIGIGILCGFMSMIIFPLFITNSTVFVYTPPICISLCSLMLIHMLLKKSTQSNRLILPVIYAKKRYNLMHLWDKLTAYITYRYTEFNFWDYLQQKLPKDIVYYILFSFYIIVTGYCGVHTFLSYTALHTPLELVILFPSLFVATFFLTYIIFPTPYLKKMASLIWLLGQFYFLFLAGTGMLVLSKFAFLPLLIFIFNLYIAVLISSLRNVLYNLTFAIILVSIGFLYLKGTIVDMNGFVSVNYNVTCFILILFILTSSLSYYTRCKNKLSTTILELKSGQEVQNARQFFSKQQIEALAYESDYVVTQLHNQLLYGTQAKSPSVTDTIAENNTRLKKYFNSIFTHLKHNLHLTINWISIDQLLGECLDAIKIKHVQHTPYVINHTEHLYIQCDIERIKNLLINSLYSCELHTLKNNKTRKDIYIYISDTKLGYRLTLLQGKIQKINAISFIITTTTQRPPTLPIYKVVEMADVQILDEDKTKGAAHAENYHIINAHYGYCTIDVNHETSTHLYVIPVNIQEITKAFTTLSPVVYTQSVSLDAASKAEEDAFIEKVKLKKNIHLQTILDTLQLIKLYYAGQKRKTGELFYLHPVAVASILLDITEDNDIIVAGLVHDVIQNTPLTEAGLATLLGEHLTKIVLTVARLDHQLPFKRSEYNQYIQQILNDQNYKAIFVKLADTLHNARTIHGHSMEKQIEKANLIQTFYVPLAERMYLTAIAHELYMHATKVLNAPFAIT